MLAASVVAAGLLSPAPSAGQKTEPDFEILRKSMVRTQLRSRDINDEKVLRAMEAVPRHLFVLPATRARAYEDYPLPIEEGQTISQPYIVALMTQLLELRGGERVLEVGTGSGYQAAVLSKIVAEVFTIEYFPSLARSAAERLKALGFTNVEVRAGDGFFGWPEKAPFGAIIVTAAASRIPAPLVDQLKEGGRLVLPVENAEGVQTLTRVTKIGGKTKVEPISLVRFVPLLGEDKKKK
jgi:protein-L-isoaspartate(D-aspartate) O-methyltransferase